VSTRSITTASVRLCCLKIIILIAVADLVQDGRQCRGYTVGLHLNITSSSAVVKRPRDASCQ